MTFQLILQNSSPPSASPYRLLDGQGRELAWANAFLDAQRLRQLSLRSLRAYGYDLLHLARWLHLKRHRLAQIDRSCSTMSATNSISCPSPRLPLSIIVSPCWAVSIVSTTDARFLAAKPIFIAAIRPDHLSAMAGRIAVSRPLYDSASLVAW
jgi:hypothetical protein